MSDLSIYLKLGWLNLWLHPLRTLLTASALAVGIAALTFLSAMNDGWLQQIKTNFALTVTGHLQVHAEGFELSRKLEMQIASPDPLVKQIEQLPQVQLVTKRARVSGLVSSAGASGSALVYGVEASKEQQMSRLAGFVSVGGWLPSDDAHAVVLGDGLADKLSVGLGDKVVLTASIPSGDIVSEVFRVRGLIHSGVIDVDDLIALVNLPAMQQWLQLDQAVTDIVIRVRDFDQVTPASDALKQSLQQDSMTTQQLEVLRWFDIDPMAQQWSEFADVYTWIVLLIVIVVVLAEVLNTMLMSLHERVREFGLMSALGVRQSQVFAMVIWETIILVLLGSVAGFVLGGGLSLWYGDQGIDLSQYAVAFSFMYMDPVIHPLLNPESVIRILGAAVVGAMLAGLIPAWRASKLEPAMALREV